MKNSGPVVTISNMQEGLTTVQPLLNWVDSQDAQNKARIALILDEARKLLDKTLEERGSTYEYTLGRKFSNYIYEAWASDIRQAIDPTLWGLLSGIAELSPSLEPTKLETISVHISSLQLLGASPHHLLHVNLYPSFSTHLNIDIPRDNASTDFSNTFLYAQRLVEAANGLTMHWTERIQSSPDMRANLAVLAAREFTRPEVLAVARKPSSFKRLF